VREEIHVLEAARARQQAVELADRGDYGAAQAKLKAFAADLRRLPQASQLLLGEAASLEEAATTVNRDAYLASGANRKRLQYSARNAQRQRRRNE
jgi:hypothetical protein